MRKDEIFLALKMMHVGEWVQEYRFCNERRFKADYANLQYRILVEYEGLFSHKSRHTTIKGFTNDCTKYNLAQIKGFRVLRYTAVNLSQMIDDIKQLIEYDKRSENTD
jgi:very-short-patch-repair endonuclease